MGNHSGEKLRESEEKSRETRQEKIQIFFRKIKYFRVPGSGKKKIPAAKPAKEKGGAAPARTEKSRCLLPEKDKSPPPKRERAETLILL